MKLFITLLFIAFCGYSQSAKELCSQLTGDGSGKDAIARTALMKLSHTAAKSEGESRIKHETEILNCLKSSKSFEVSTFLIQQLDICGGKASLQHLAGLLNHPELGPNATRTFTNLAKFDQARANEILISAYNKKASAYLLNAISVLKINNSPALNIYRSSLNKKELMPFALQGLAQAGDSIDSKTFIEAFSKASPAFRGRTFRLNLVYTEALAAKNKNEANKHLAQLKSSLSKTDIPYLTGIAAVDFKINGVTESYLTNLPKENIHTQIGIIRVLKANKFEGISAKLETLVKTQANEPVYLLALAEVAPAKASPFVMKSLQSSNKEVRTLAAKLATNYGGEFATSLLNTLIAKGDASREDTAMAKSMVSPKNINDVVALWKDLNPSLTLAFIEVTGSIQNKNVAAKMLQTSKSSDKKVQRAALKALKDVVSAANLNELKVMINSEKSSSNLRYLQQAAANSIALSSDETVKALFSKLYNERNDKLLVAFAKSNRKEVLPLLQRDLQSGSAELQKETIKTLSSMAPELSAGLLVTAIEKAKDDRNKILAARALAEAASNSKEKKQVRKAYLNQALKQSLPENEKKLLTERLKKIK